MILSPFDVASRSRAIPVRVGCFLWLLWGGAGYTQACELPQNLSATQLDSNEFLFSWDSLDNAQAYTLRYQVAGENLWQLIPGISKPDTILAGFEESIIYQWEVRTVCDGSVSTWVRGPDVAWNESPSPHECENEPDPAFAGIDQRICTDQSFLQAAEVTSGSGKWSLIQGIGGIADPNSAKTQAFGLQAGESLFVWTVSKVGCEPKRDTVTIFRDSCGNPDFDPSAGERLGNIRLQVSTKGPISILVWEVSEEIGVNTYQIEQSLDQTFFQSIGTRVSKGNTFNTQSYQYPLPELGEDTLYFRVTAQMNSGTQFQSEILALAGTAEPSGAPRMTVFPNPIQNQRVNISVKSQFHYDAVWTLSDPWGQVLHSKNQGLFPGIQQVGIDLPDLPLGIYIFSLFYSPFLPPIQEKIWVHNPE